MDMYLEDTISVLGLHGETTVSPRTGGYEGGNLVNFPGGQSSNSRKELTIKPGQPMFAPGTPGIYLDTVRKAGGTGSAINRGPGTTRGHFSTPPLWTEGPKGNS